MHRQLVGRLRQSENHLRDFSPEQVLPARQTPKSDEGVEFFSTNMLDRGLSTVVGFRCQHLVDLLNLSPTSDTTVKRPCQTSRLRAAFLCRLSRCIMC